MKTILKSLMALIAILISTSCDRSGAFEEFQKAIPWGFCVVAHSDANMTMPVSGATVEIYLTDVERDNGGTPYLSKQTNEKGEAHFTLSEFNKNNCEPQELKGNYYLKVTKGENVATATTRYLLMNSGETYQWVQLK